MTRYRIAVRGDGIELDGYFDATDRRPLADLTDALSAFGVVVADDADPAQAAKRMVAVLRANAHELYARAPTDDTGLAAEIGLVSEVLAGVLETQIDDLGVPEHFTCQRCGMKSYHPIDLAEGYCARCHDWTRL